MGIDILQALMSGVAGGSDFLTNTYQKKEAEKQRLQDILQQILLTQGVKAATDKKTGTQDVTIDPSNPMAPPKFTQRPKAATPKFGGFGGMSPPASGGGLSIDPAAIAAEMKRRQGVQ